MFAALTAWAVTSRTQEASAREISELIEPELHTAANKPVLTAYYNTQGDGNRAFAGNDQ